MHFCANDGVADREHLVDEHDVGVGLDHHREREPDHHPRRVVLELEVGEVAQLGEVEHRVEPAPRLAPAEAHHHAVEDDVLARRQLGVEADAELDERRQPAGHADPAGVGAVDARHDLQQRALARAVAADDPEELALVDVERDVRAARAARGSSPRANGCSARSLSVSTRWSGMRKVFSTPAGLDDHGRLSVVASTPQAYASAQTRARQRRSAPLLEAEQVRGSAPGVAGAPAGARDAARRSRGPARARCRASRCARRARAAGAARARRSRRRALGGDEARRARAAWRAQPAAQRASSVCACTARGR